MFGDVLPNNLVVELLQVFATLVVVKLALARLNDVGTIGASAVSQGVAAACLQLRVNHTFDLAGRIHLCHEAFCGGFVLLEATEVEIIHVVVEGGILEVCSFD